MKTRTYYAICVDDDETILSQLETQLSGQFTTFCEFEYAENGQEALALYGRLQKQGERIWLVMTDQVMPGMTGDELLTRIHDDDQRVMKMLLTGQAGLQTLGRAVRTAGLNYYLEKPWSPEELWEAIDRLKFQYESTTLLNEMNRLFASSLDLEETLNTVFYSILTSIQAEAGSVFLVEEGSHDLVCRICQGPKDISGVRVPFGAGIVGYVAQSRQIDVTTDVKQDKRHYGQIDEQSGFTTKSMISVPLVSKDVVLGVIQVINKAGGKQFSQNDLRLLQALSSGGALAIQNAQYARRLVQQERIRSELLIAHQIQQGILPGKFSRHPAIHFEAFTAPAKVVGGDFYDYFQIGTDEFAFMIGDVCGKGVPAAIFMASCRSILKAQAMGNPDPRHVIPLANRLIVQDARQNGLYVTVFYGVYHTQTRVLRYTNAGHPLALLFRSTTATCSSLFQRDLPLGMFGTVTFEEVEMTLQPGDTLVFYTDGVNEAENVNREPFGMEQLVQIVLAYGEKSPEELQQAIVERVQQFSEGQEQRDDLTVLIVRV